MRERGDDLLDHTVCKIILLRIIAHILKRQNGNRWLVGEFRICGDGNFSPMHEVNADWPFNIFEDFFSLILKVKVEASTEVITYRPRNGHLGGVILSMRAATFTPSPN